MEQLFYCIFKDKFSNLMIISLADLIPNFVWREGSAWNSWNIRLFRSSNMKDLCEEILISMLTFSSICAKEIHL